MAGSNLRLDPEFALAYEAMNFSGTAPASKNDSEIRNDSEESQSEMDSGSLSIPDHILRTILPFETHDGTSLNLHHFTAVNKTNSSYGEEPAVLYVHGSGMVAGNVSVFSVMIADFVDTFGMDFFAVEYRLAPEQKGQGLVEDVYHGLEHLSKHAQEHMINPNRIAIMGQSAGGSLAAGAGLLARDRALDPPIAKQILVYPMLDDRTCVPENSSYEEFLRWTEEDNDFAWGAVLGDDVAGDPAANVSTYAVPGRATNLTGLPPTYIDVGQLDLFVIENIAYASKLVEAEVEVELHIFPGLPHGFEIATNVSLFQMATSARQRALKMV
ncbi:arylesterase monooxygenase [Colletotrichum sojae]|uniref:Arylesterase monooxygenase n=1 Tax=Colletotrichum sojae TaxID=2175907 RepID=A0A8H6IST3_9PEZI|nr:arylesterase monooxygenase [Colletotrichum sojae]